MSLELQISTDSRTVVLDLDEGNLADRIRECLPFQSRVSTWGDEIYFPVPVDGERGTLTKDVSVGDVAFWHEGESLAIFFGPTPMSGDDGVPVPADEVELIGHVIQGLEELENVQAGENLTIEAAN